MVDTGCSMFSSPRILYVGGSGPGNYSSIQEAVNDAVDGDIVYVYSGLYNETIVIDESITLLGENRDYTVIKGKKEEWVIKVSSSYVTVNGFTIQNLDYNGEGVQLEDVEYCVISNNRINANGCSIFLSYSSNNFLTYNIIEVAGVGLILDYSNNNIIQGNKISNCSVAGIYIELSDNNILANNVLNNNDDGLYLSYSSNNTILNNTITSSYSFGLSMSTCFNNTLRGNRLIGNCYNLRVVSWRWGATDFYHNIDTSNTINGKPIYYLVEKSNLIVDESTNAGFVALVSCNNIEVKNLVLENNSCGILVVNTTHSRISNIKACNNMDGIEVDSSSYNILSNNTLSNNEAGVVLWISHDNLIFNNSITGSEHYGVLVNGYNYPYISNSSYNIITGNIIKESRIGLSLGWSIGNTITKNDIEYNEKGLYLEVFSNLNRILRNNFIDNNIDAYFSTSFLNFWFNNYWNKWPWSIPKPIRGEVFVSFVIILPWYNFDWHPALKPYDIGGNIR